MLVAIAIVHVAIVVSKLLRDRDLARFDVAATDIAWNNGSGRYT